MSDPGDYRSLLFGRRQCQVGHNEPDMEGLRRALRGGDTFMTA